jgi:TP901 family phage tail tape measure protein
LGNELQLGMGIIFDDTTLRQLNSILTYVQKLQKQFDGIGDPFKKMKQPIMDVNAQVDKLTTKINQGTEAFNKSKKAATGLGDSLVHNVKKMTEWAVSATLLYGTIRGLQQSFKTMIDLETEAVNIAKVLPENVALRPFEERAIKLAKQYGQSVIDVEKATANWAKQYKNVQDVAIATQASLLAATATDIGFEQSVKSLSAIIAEWNLEAKDSIHIVDMLNEVSNNYRVTAEGVAEALARSGSGARALGMTMEQLTGIVTTGIQALGMEGRQVGTFWTRTMARMRGNDSAVAAIQKLGIDAMQPLSTLMDEIAAKWDLMSSGEKQNFAITIAGTQHWSRFTGIMDNYNTVIEATSKSYNSMNSAQQEVDRVMQMTAKHIEQLNAQWQEYIYRNSEVLKVTKNIVDILRTLIAGLAQFNPLTVVAGVVALTFAFQGLFAAIMSTTTAFSVATVGLLSNPWTAPIVAITAVAGALLLVGNNANKAQNEVLKMQTELANFEQYNSGIINQSRGIIDLANKYEIFQKAIEKAKKSGQDYSKLNDKFKVAQTELAKAIGVSTAELEMMVQKDGSIKTFMENRLKENAALINSEREKANAIKMATKAQLEAQLKPYQSLMANLQKDYQKYLYQVESASYSGDSFKMTQSRINAERTNQNIKEVQSRMQPFLDELNKIKIDTKVTTVDDFYNTGTGSGGFGEDEPRDKIKTIFSTLTEENIRFIEAIGQTWDAKFGLESDRLKFINPLIGSSINTNLSSESNNYLSNIFDSVNKTIEDFIKSLDQIEIDRQKALSRGATPMEAEKQATDSLIKLNDDYGKKLQEQYDLLAQATKGLDMANPALKGFADYMQYLKARIDSAKVISGQTPKFNEKQVNLITTAFDSLTNSLTGLGTTAGDVAAIITKSFSGSFGLNGFDPSKLMQGIGIGLLDMAIGKLFGSIFGGSKPSVPRYEQEKYDVATALNERNLQDARLRRIAELEEARREMQTMGEQHDNATFLALAQGLQDVINEVNDEIKKAIDNWNKALGVSINDIASKIEEAFDASNAFDFLQNWNQSLYEMTRSALIRGFMAQEAFQGLYRNLSETIGLAVLDGQLSAEELLNIRTQGNALGSQLSVLYQALSGLEGAFGISPGSSGGESNYTAGSSVPINYTFYISVNSQAFMGDQDDARTFGLQIWDVIQDEIGRA